MNESDELPISATTGALVRSLSQQLYPTLPIGTKIELVHQSFLVKTAVPEGAHLGQVENGRAEEGGKRLSLGNGARKVEGRRPRPPVPLLGRQRQQRQLKLVREGLDEEIGELRGISITSRKNNPKSQRKNHKHRQTVMLKIQILTLKILLGCLFYRAL